MSIAYKNNSFKAILNVSKPILDSDQVATDLHFFFKRSTARREDYKMVENNGSYNALHEEACRITLAEHRSFTCPNTRANGEFERMFFKGDTETKEV